jgi:speckle-type POZ protein
MPTPTTVSTGALETEKGRHLFRIVGYSQLRGMGRLIKSGIFSVGQHRWVVALRPAPINNDLNAGNVHVALVLYGTSAGQVWASYELNLVDQRTGLSLSVHKEAPRKFGHKSHHDFKSKASINVKQRSVFESPNYLHNDCLTIECIVTVIHEQRRPETKRFPSIEVPPSDITEHFGKLLETKEGADATFSVGGVEFTAHKMVLTTRSPVFKAELYGAMRAGMDPIVIKDIQPDVFGALIHFIYTDSLPPLDDLEAEDYVEMVRHLLVAADRYAMERLKLMCQSILCKNLHVQTVATTLALADQHHCGLLKDACIAFITCSDSMDAVAETECYKSLKRTCPSVVIEVLENTSRARKA